MVNELFSNELDKAIAAIALNEPTPELRDLLEKCHLYFCGVEFIIDCRSERIFRSIQNIERHVHRLVHRKDLIKTFCLQYQKKDLAYRFETDYVSFFGEEHKGKKLIEFVRPEILEKMKRGEISSKRSSKKRL